MILAYPYALAAVNAALLCDYRLMISDADRLSRTALYAVYAPLAQIRVQADRVCKYRFVVQHFTPLRDNFPYC